jgi:hypothetical protein
MRRFYEYDGQLLPITEKNITIKYLENGKLKIKSLKPILPIMVR